MANQYSSTRVHELVFDFWAASQVSHYGRVGVDLFEVLEVLMNLMNGVCV